MAVRLAQPGQNCSIDYEGQLPPLERNRDHRGVLRRHAADGVARGQLPGLRAAAGIPARPSCSRYRVKLAVPRRPARPGGRQAGCRNPAGSGRRALPGKLRIQPAQRWHRPDGRAVDRVREKRLARPGQRPC